MIDDLNYAVRKLVRTVLAMPENTVRPANQNAPSGGQTDEIATVDIISDRTAGTGAVSYATTGTYPNDVTTERVEGEHVFVASVNFYRRPPTSGYLRGATVSATVASYTAIANGAFDIALDGVNRQISGLNFTGASSMAAIASTIQTRLQVALPGAKCVWDATNSRFVVTSPTTAQSSAVGGAVAPTVGGVVTNVSATLGLTIAGGAISVNNRAGIARYSNAAFDRASRLTQRLALSSSTMLMNQLGIAFLGASQPRNLTELVDSTWECRGQVDLTFAAINRESEAIQTIVKVPLTTKFQSPGGDVATRTAEVTT